METACFVRLPSRLENLMRPFPAESEKPYVVERVVWLNAMDYENFVTDFTVERWFIEENTGLCRVDKRGVWHCLLVRRRGRTDGVLVMPEGFSFPKWAAYLPQA